MQQRLGMVTLHRLPILARPGRHAEMHATGSTPLRRGKPCIGSCQAGAELCHAWSWALHLTLTAPDGGTTNSLAQAKFDEATTASKMGVAIVKVFRKHRDPELAPAMQRFSSGTSTFRGHEAIRQALVPPSTFRLVPVTNAASGLANQATRLATSSPDP